MGVTAYLSGGPTFQELLMNPNLEIWQQLVPVLFLGTDNFPTWKLKLRDKLHLGYSN